MEMLAMQIIQILSFQNDWSGKDSTISSEVGALVPERSHLFCSLLPRKNNQLSGRSCDGAEASHSSLWL